MIVAFAGRRIDEIDAINPRFPIKNIDKVKEKITKYFIRNKLTFLVSAAAYGSDIIALEVALDLKVEIQVILPFKPEFFKIRSVIDRDTTWGPRFDKIINTLMSSNHLVYSDTEYEDDNSFKKCNTEILNFALSKFEINKKFSEYEELRALIAWDGKKKITTDITFNFIEQARMRKIKIDFILTNT